MHKSELPESALRIVQARSHGLTLFPLLQPKQTALVVVDLQNAFMLSGMALETPIAREIVPNVNRLARALRDAGGHVVWLKVSMAGQRQAWSVWFENMLTPHAAADMEASLSPGHRGFELYAELDVKPGDLVVEKRRFSAFTPGSSDLDQRMRGLGVDTVVITGTLTNNCCESTARDAMMLNYKVVFVSDGTATRTDEEHNATLANVARIVGEVATTEQVLGKFAPSRAK
ncbi:MAG: isochorismatase family cysteine hydrolase [Burkholderiales bacterium]